jgi:hypothetical protein
MYSVLNIAPGRFLDAYNLDIEDYVERHTFKESAQKGGKEINYMSYSHAYRLFRMHFPELEVALEENPKTGGYIFKEIDDRGYFLKAFVYTAENVPFSDRNNGMHLRRTASLYYPVLSVSGMSVYPDELETVKDWTTKETKEKPGRYVANIQLFNKANQRALVKAIALTTGIGLKLWTGDDLSEDILDKKFTLLEAVMKRAEEYEKLTGYVYAPKVSNLDTISLITTEGKNITRLITEYKAANNTVVPTTPGLVELETPEVSATKTTKTTK